MDEQLIPVTKGGEVIEVHPSTLADHKRNGWVEAPAAPAADESTAPKARKGATKE